MKINNILYIGGHGQLAKYFREESAYKVTSRNKQDEFYLDIEKPNESKLLVTTTNSLFIFGAAISSPIHCENNSAQCYYINYKCTRDIINILLNNNNKIVFLSSDLVYSGYNESISCSEDTIPKPINIYEKLKVKIEQHFMHHENFHIIRLSFILFNNNSFYSYLNYCIKNRLMPEIIKDFYRHSVKPNKIKQLIDYYHKNSVWPKSYNLSGIKTSREELYFEWCKIANINPIQYELIQHDSSPMKNVPKYINFKSKYNYV